MTKKFVLMLSLLFSTGITCDQEFSPDDLDLPKVTQKDLDLLEQNPDIDFVFMPDAIRDLINDKSDKEKIDVNVAPRDLLLVELDKKLEDLKSHELSLNILRSYKESVENGEALISYDEIQDNAAVTRKNKNKTFCSLRVKKDLRVCGAICAQCIKLGAFTVSSRGLSFGTNTFTFDPATGRFVLNGDLQVNNAFVNGNANIMGTANVAGQTNLNGGVNVMGNANISGDANVGGNAAVTGNATFDMGILNTIGNSSTPFLNLMPRAVMFDGTTAVTTSGQGFTASFSSGTPSDINVVFSENVALSPAIVVAPETSSTLDAPISFKVINKSTSGFTARNIDPTTGSPVAIPTGAGFGFIGVAPQRA